MRTVANLIADRRDGIVQPYDDFVQLSSGAAGGTIPDYQLAAWLMAAYLKPLTLQETIDLTRAMAESGDKLDLRALPLPHVDKHSTGGVGDKATLIVLPILAASGVTCVKMSGRGLGITGGTIDKLESVPGFNTSLSPLQMVEQANRIGIALSGQSPALAPADKALYSLRDVTQTVGSVPLIVSSILSKKLAGGSKTIVLDVKCGSGAFMTGLKEARLLSNWLIQVGQALGLDCRVAISDMDQPLGAVGNALEVRQARKILSGEWVDPGTARVRELCLLLAGEALWAAGLCGDASEGYGKAQECLETGLAFKKASAWFAAQGGSLDAELPTAPNMMVLRATCSGWVSRIEAETVGRVVVNLGGGRMVKSDVIDPSVGVEVHRPVGEKVSVGDALFTIHSRDLAGLEEARKTLLSSIVVQEQPCGSPPLILDHDVSTF
jgi:pyrimidine-nucleoside phosphorylase